MFSLLPGFRSNSIITIDRTGKVRPVIYLSVPTGKSYNENIDEGKLKKVNVSKAKSFSYTLKERAKMWNL